MPENPARGRNLVFAEARQREVGQILVYFGEALH